MLSGDNRTQYLETFVLSSWYLTSFSNYNEMYNWTRRLDEDEMPPKHHTYFCCMLHNTPDV